MRILVVVKEVPDSRATIRVQEDGSGIAAQGVKFVCNPFDEYAVEQAIQLKEQRSDVDEVVAVIACANASSQALRTALAMGCDRGIHIADDSISWYDDVLIAEAVAGAIQKDDNKFDIIFCGKQTIDTDSCDIGPTLAEFTQRPHVGGVIQFELSEDGSKMQIHRQIEGALEVIEATTPMLITCDKGLVEPRYPSLPNLMKAKKKPVTVCTLADLDGISDAGQRISLVKLTPPAKKPPCVLIEGEPEEMAKELVRVLSQEAKVV